MLFLVSCCNYFLLTTSYFLQKVKCCEVGISKLRDNVSTSGMSSFSRAFRYMRSPCVRNWSTVWVVYERTATDWANKNEKLIKEHCPPLEISLNRSWPWWLLPSTNKVEFDIIRHLPNTDEHTVLLYATSDVLPAAGHTITRAQNYSDISKSSNREFCCYSKTKVAQPQLQD